MFVGGQIGNLSPVLGVKSVFGLQSQLFLFDFNDNAV
ncbi:MAG: hypothetical protein ACI8SG_000527 [Marinobacter psychrophilus]|jgi:hypothetical protein